MKNKVIALSLLITALSVVPAFAATKDDCNGIDLNKILSSSKITQNGKGASEICDSLINDLLKSNGLPCNESSEKVLSENLKIWSSKNTKMSTDDIVKLINEQFNKTNQGNKQPEVKLPETKNPGTEKPVDKQPDKKPGTDKPGDKQPDKKPGTEKPETPNNGNNNGSSSVSSYERQVFDLVNAERAKAGLAPLKLDSSISNVARAKSKDMATNNYFSHTSPTYGNAGSMLKQFGISYTAYGENIASGQKTPQQVVTAWMNSQGHRENILSSTFTKIGVGYATNSKGVAYWTQMFTR